MTDKRPDLNTVRTQYQVADDKMIDYHPRAFGAIDIPFTDSVKVTKTEGALLDELTWQRGLAGLQDFDGIRKRAFSEGVERFPDNPVPGSIPADRAREWQGNDGHRDAFRHAYWNALMAQKYGENWASAFATAHEGVPGNTANREAMDLYNNQIGRSIGAANRNVDPEKLADLVEQALNQGKLVVIDGKGNLEWSDRVAKGAHGLAPNEVIGPNLRTPGVVAPDTSSVSYNAPGQPQGTMLAAADPNVDRMKQDPLYNQAAVALNAKGIVDDTLTANVYAAAKREGLAGVTGVEVGTPVADANGRADRTLFVFDGTQGPLGPNHARLSENEARTTPALVAANTAFAPPAQQLAQPEQEQRRSMTA